MESIGEKLRSAREAKKIAIRDVSRETNIAPTYLVALEEEEFEKFPSETYLIGFLRAYSEFLKLDVEEIIQAYKGYKIGESVTPLEELTKPTRTTFPMLLSSFSGKVNNYAFIGAAVIAALLLVWIIVKITSSGIDTDSGQSVEKARSEYKNNLGAGIENLKSLQLQNEKGDILVYKDEAIQFLVENKEVLFLLKEIWKDKQAVKIEVLPGKRDLELEMDAERGLELAGMPREVIFCLKGLTENRAKLMVRLGKQLEAVPEKVQGNTETVVPVTANTEVVAQNMKSLKIIFEAEFVQKSFIELYLDGVKKMQGFVPEGTVERWEASEHMQIKIGNAGGVKSRINGKVYVFGRSGEVVNKVITWKKDVNNPNLYHLIVKDW